MRPYTQDFHIEHNPVIMVNDWLSGMYLINLRSAKSASLEPRDYKIVSTNLYYDYRSEKYHKPPGYNGPPP